MTDNKQEISASHCVYATMQGKPFDVQQIKYMYWLYSHLVSRLYTTHHLPVCVTLEILKLAIP